ncbi:Hemicentin-1 [Stylophora pistillata]|uniref:Hemicentin-1 n=1 Tax=Stylophora pistillata TaxID=50429 RepID=A0A2B4SMR3_STYPI|nr:Hemicentin-1 [Stylophora pistillata]
MLPQIMHFYFNIQSKEKLLSVAEPSPPRFLIKNPHQLSVPNGGNTTLTCTATGIPLPVITWYKNGHPVLRSSVTEFKGYSQLRLQGAGVSDQGEYWCEANSTEGWDRTSLTTLNVLWKPVFFTHPQRHIAHLNRDGFAVVTLSCKAKGFPSPVISWLQNNSSSTLDATTTQKGSKSSLTVVFKKETEQPLKYRCLAMNSMGKTLSKEGEVTIIATARQNLPVSDDKSSSSLSISEAVWISIPVGIVFVTINSILLFVFYKKFNGPTAARNQMNYTQRFPNLQMHAIAMSTRREEQTTPRYEMTQTV